MVAIVGINHYSSRMAFLRQRGDGRVEIRESTATPRGPRARTLVTFRGALTPDVLERAAERARRRFDPVRLRARADALGIPCVGRRPERAARSLLARLRRDAPLDPVWVTLLREALAGRGAAPVPTERAEVADWIGVGPRRRGQALRGLVRTADRIVRSRPGRRERPRRVFPHFSSAPEAR